MSAKPMWPYIRQTLEIGGRLEVATEGYRITLSSLECDGQTVCMFPSDNMTFDDIMNRL